MRCTQDFLRRIVRACGITFAIILPIILLPGGSTASDCSKTSVGFIPLTNLGTGLYKGRQGGLYPGGNNVRPTAHEAAGLALAKSIRPADATGKPDDAGKIVLLSIGMSNTTQEFSTFKPMADADPAKNTKLVIVDGAQGGMSADRIYDLQLSSAQQFWTTVDARLSAAGVSPAQVQAAWIKQADISPTAPFPDDAVKLKGELVRIVQILKSRFPNIKLAYCSSRIYGGYASTALNPEPFAYQSGFSVKWLIEDQINGAPELNYDPRLGEIKAPWLAWGPYLWADGLTPRSDGLTYACSDLADDGTHPAPGGARQKVADLLAHFFKNDSTAAPWFLTNIFTLRFPAPLNSANGQAGNDESRHIGMAIANLGAAEASVTFTGFDPGGASFTGKTFTVAAGGQFPIVDSQVFASAPAGGNGIGWIKAESSGTKLVAMFLLFNDSFSLLDGDIAFSAGLASFVLPEMQDQGTTELYLSNPNPASAQVTIGLLRSDGSTPVQPAARKIPPNGSLREPVSSIFPAVGVSRSDYLRVTSNQGLLPLEVWGMPRQDIGILGGQSDSAGATILYCPQYVVGEGWDSTLSLVNLEASAGTLTMEFIGDDGSVVKTNPITVWPRGKVAITEPIVKRGGDMLQGYLRIVSSVRLAGAVVFGDAAEGRFVAALPLVAAPRNSLVFGHLASSATYFTGIALLNPGDTAAGATIEVLDSAGNRLAQKMETLAAKSRISRVITEIFPSLSAGNYTSGYIRVTADKPIAGFAVFGTNNLSAVSAIPAQPIP